MENKYKKQVVWWLFSGCFLVFAMVVIGGITRLTRSGLSITEWNPLMGAIPPLNGADWQAAFAKYQLSPEFQKINFDMKIDEFKFIFWWEFMHRLVGRLIGVVFIIPFVYFYFKKALDKKLTYKLLGVFALGGLQGFIGWYMVASGLVDNPHVSHYRLATHLITAFITFGYIFWLALDILYPRTENLKANDNSRLLAKLILPLVMIQIVYGAFVAGLKAGLIYNTFPKMGDTWVPDAVTAMKPMLSNFFENMAGVQFVHRYIAWGLTILIALAWFGMKEQKLTERQHKSTNYLGAMVLLQFTLGVLTLLFAVPIWLGAIHQIGAFFLFAAAIFFYHQTRYSKIIPQS